MRRRLLVLVCCLVVIEHLALAKKFVWPYCSAEVVVV
jgi:hypothetical protein